MSGRSTLAAATGAGISNSDKARSKTGVATGRNAPALVSQARSYTPDRVFRQHACEAGMLVSPHVPGMVRQQARSGIVIGASGIMQAIAGARNDATSRTSAPNWRRYFTATRIIPVADARNQDGVVAKCWRRRISKSARRLWRPIWTRGGGAPIWGKRKIRLILLAQSPLASGADLCKSTKSLADCTRGEPNVAPLQHTSPKHREIKHLILALASHVRDGAGAGPGSLGAGHRLGYSRVFHSLPPSA